MNLANFPRRRYTPTATPLHPLTRLSALLGGPEIWIKRDDLTGLTGGGNKTRKLEFLVADAIAQGADTLITCGAVQSNHCRLTLSAAVHEGLKCRLVLEERVPNSFDKKAGGNNFLYDILGVEQKQVFPGGTNLGYEMAKVAAALEAEGRKGYIIPGGGSNALGALGYVTCAYELTHQCFEQGLPNFDHLICASGSGGTHAGLIAGMVVANTSVPVLGVSVRHPKAKQEPHILQLTRATAELLGASADLITPTKIEVADSYVGDGYSLPTESMVEAVTLLAKTEGILLDTVYTGKAFAGLLDLVRKGRWSKDQRIVFVHTGGSPSLYHYREELLPQ